MKKIPLKRVSIMLADDHVVVRESIRKLLEDEEIFQVVGEAGDGESAVKLAAALKPRVLVIDIDMPKLNGIEATRKIKELSPETAVLILTAYDYEQYIFPILESGASGYLLKDVSGQELVRAISAVVRGEPVLHPVVAGKVMQHMRCVKAAETTEQLTSREKEVLRLASMGMRNREIAGRLFLSVRTVETHLRNVFSKIGVNSRTEAILTALRQGIIKIEQLDGGE